MISSKQIEALTSYNVWANKRIIQWLKSNDQELITQECQSSFSSILKTINHIWDGELFYISALKEQPIHKAWDGSIEKAYEGLVSQSEEFLEYVEVQDIHALEVSRSVTIKTIDGVFPQYELIQHCMNHSTFHRGQIITMGHQLGLNKAPSTDMLFYIIKKGMEK